MNKSVTERWWDLYLDDRRCKRHFNGLHLVCALYGDCDEDSDTLMQSMAKNKNYQLENFEFTDNESLFKDTLSTSMWNDQHPEGYFAHLQSQLPKIRRLDICPYTNFPISKNWEEWGWNIISIDEAIKRKLNNIWIGRQKVERLDNIWIGKQRLEGLLTEDQKTELKNRLKYYHGEERNGKKVVNDCYNPWMSAHTDYGMKYVRH